MFILVYHAINHGNENKNKWNIKWITFDLACNDLWHSNAKLRKLSIKVLSNNFYARIFTQYPCKVYLDIYW